MPHGSLTQREVVASFVNSETQIEPAGQEVRPSEQAMAVQAVVCSCVTFWLQNASTMPRRAQSR